MAFQVACAQFAPKKAQVAANIARIAELIQQASTEGADLVLFPEAATSGYFLEGGVLESSLESGQLLDMLVPQLEGLKEPIDALIGFYEVNRGNLYNSAAYLQLGPQEHKVVHVYRKFFLPTYGVFDEERFVSRGHELGVFDSRLGRMGVLICEDIWHSVLPMLNAVAGAQMLLVPSASPARGFSGATIDNLDRYERMIRAVTEEHGVYCANCQLIGFEGGKGFIGGSSVTDPRGRLLARGPVGEEHLVIAPVDFDFVTVARTALPLISDLQTAWSDIKRLAGEVEP